jgi:hypothetical protein
LTKPILKRGRSGRSKSSESEEQIVARLKRLPIDVRNRSAQARKRLGVTAKQLEGVRRITPSLREAGLSTDRVIEILEGDGDEDAISFLARWRRISKTDRKYLSLEEVCIASGLTTRRLWEVISGAVLEQSQDIVKVRLAHSQASVVAAAVKAATDSLPILANVGGVNRVVGYTNGDVKAMEVVSKWTGLMPTPKGSTTNILLGGGQGAAPAPLGSCQDDDDEEDEELLPDMGDFLKDIQVTVAPPKQLEAPKPTESLIAKTVVEAEFEELPLVR